MDDQTQNIKEENTNQPEEVNQEEAVVAEDSQTQEEQAQEQKDETSEEQTADTTSEDENKEEIQEEQGEKAEEDNEPSEENQEEEQANSDSEDTQEEPEEIVVNSGPQARWYVVHTYSGHENRVATALKQRVDSEHLENKILQILVPTQEKIEIRGGKKETIKEKIFPGYILVKMILDDTSWLAVRTTQGVTSFIGMSQKPTPISEKEVQSIVQFMEQGGQPTYKTAFIEGDTVKIVDGPFAEFIGKVESVDKEKGKVRVLVSIFGRETPVELDFLQVAKL